MPDMRVIHLVVEDDGSDGIFWRNGERFLRERGVEKRLKNLTPHLETKFHENLLSGLVSSYHLEAHRRSLDTEDTLPAKSPILNL